MNVQKVPAVYRPTRADQRTARQVRANLREGEPCRVLARIAAGPLDRVIRFLAGCDVVFVLIGYDEQPKFFAFGSPTAESVAELCRHLLGGHTEVPIDADIPVSAMEGPRLWSTREAVDEIVDGLRARGICFLLGWCLPGNDEVRLDRVLGAAPRKVDEHLRWFLTEQLHVALPRAELPTCMDEVAVLK